MRSKRDAGEGGADTRGDLTCEAVARRLASDGGEPVPGAAAVADHLARCAACREYAAQLESIGAAARDLAGRSEEEGEAVRRLLEAVLEPRSSRAEGA
ncbi:MAG: hypothetical protein D6718_05875 [Acidobacteria bacterium]|nr:MAG: hypothetical protein D6718_05875 [Acidobacteriota bacterium]